MGRTNLVRFFALLLPLLFLGAPLIADERLGVGHSSNGDTRREGYFNQFDTESVNIAVDKRDCSHIVWVEVLNGFISIYYSKLDRNGATVVDDKLLFKEPVNNTVKRPVVPGNMNRVNNNNPPREPDIEVDSDQDIHISFEVNGNIYYTKLDNNGLDMILPMPLTRSSGASTDSNLAIGYDDSVHVVWMDYRTGPMFIYYSKMGNDGQMLVSEMRVSSRDCFDPCIVRNSTGIMQVCWFQILINQFNNAIGTQLIYEEIDNNGNLLHKRALDFFDQDVDQRSVDLTISSQNRPAFIWTCNNQLAYYPLGEATDFSDSDIQDAELDFEQDTRKVYSIELDEVGSDCRYFVQVTLYKEFTGLCSGDILFLSMDGNSSKVGDWDFSLRPYLFYYTMEYEVTDLMGDPGKYQVHFEKTLGLRMPDIISVRLIIDADSMESEEMNLILAQGSTFEPAACVDSADNVHIVFYDSLNSNNDIYYVSCDFEGKVIMPRTRVTYFTQSVYDPAIDKDSTDALNIVYFDNPNEYDALFFMKMDATGTIIQSSKQVSNEREVIPPSSEEDDEDGSEGRFSFSRFSNKDTESDSMSLESEGQAVLGLGMFASFVLLVFVMMFIIVLKDPRARYWLRTGYRKPPR